MDVFLLSMQPVQGFSDKERALTQVVHSKHIEGYRIYRIHITQAE